jgi:hypothetical protein
VNLLNHSIPQLVFVGPKNLLWNLNEEFKLGSLYSEASCYIIDTPGVLLFDDLLSKGK